MNQKSFSRVWKDCLLRDVSLISSGSSDVISYVFFGLSPKYVHRHMHLQFLNPLDNLSDIGENQIIAWLMMTRKELNEQ